MREYLFRYYHRFHRARYSARWKFSLHPAGSWDWIEVGVRKMKRLLKHPVIVAIIPVILSFILTVLYDMAKNRQLLSTAKNILSFIINCVTSFLQFNIKVWWIVAAMIIIIGILFILFKIGNAKNYKQSNPLWIQYRKDSINGWNWEWKWRRDSFGRYYVDDLHPVCNYCGSPLVYGDDFCDYLKCVRCNRRFQRGIPQIDHIKMLISDNVQRGLFPKSEDQQWN